MADRDDRALDGPLSVGASVAEHEDPKAMENAMRIRAIQSTLRVLAVGALSALGCSGHDSPSVTRSDLTAWPGPPFPGAGTSGAGHGIAAGIDTVTCDSGTSPIGSFGPAPGSQAHIVCLYDASSTTAATIEWIVEAAENTELVHVRLTMNPDFVDNTYGANAIGWDKATMTAPGGTMAPASGAAKPAKMGKGGHTFKDLVGSDHAEFKLSDGAGTLVLHFKADYISPELTFRSGYASLGVLGGDGKMLLGNASDVVRVSSSLERNLNECLLSSFTVDSPPTDAHYTPSKDAETWDYRVVYDVWVRKAAFGAAGFGSALVDFVHASPSKVGTSTVDVTPGECSPDWEYCTDPDGCGACKNGLCNPPPPPPAVDAGSLEQPRPF
jgi:hypothetical protein